MPTDGESHSVGDSLALQVAFARLEGKVDTLTTKFDDRLDSVLNSVKAGDRESAQLVALQEQRIEHHAEKLTELDKRIVNVVTTVQSRFDELDGRLDSQEKWQARVMGAAAVALALGGVGGAAIAKAVGL